MPQNFMRHYYDVYCLLDDDRVQAFVGTDAYHAHKAKRFPRADEIELSKNAAFLLKDVTVRSAFETAYHSTGALYYRSQPAFSEVLERIHENLNRL